MAETTCPFCHVALFESEVATGECTSCMQKLPRRGSRSPLALTGRVAVATAAGEGWQGVRSGVGLLALATFAEVVLGPMLLVGAWGRNECFFWVGNRDVMDLLLLFGLFALATAGVVGLVGLILSLSAPARSGLRTWRAVGSGVLFFLSPLMIGAPLVLLPHTRLYLFEWLLISMVLIGIVMLFVSSAWYSVYLRGVARSFRDEPLGIGFLTFAIVTPVLGLLGIAGVFVLLTMHKSSSEAEILIVTYCGFWAFVLLLWFGVMLYRLYRLVPALASRRLPPEDE